MKRSLWNRLCDWTNSWPWNVRAPLVILIAVGTWFLVLLGAVALAYRWCPDTIWRCL